MKAVKGFITNKERDALLEWATDCRKSLKPNGVTPYRFFNFLDKLPHNNLVSSISERVLDNYGLGDTPKIDGHLGSLLSWHEEHAAVHPHTDDPRLQGYRHYRFNLFLSVPNVGGVPIYNGEQIDVEEGMLVPYEADVHEHSSTKVVGDKPRIIISFGWLFKESICN